MLSTSLCARRTDVLVRTSLLVDMPRTPTFDARAIAMDHVTREGLVVLEPRAARPQNWNQVFDPGEDEDIGLIDIAISRQALVGLVGNGGNGRINPSQSARVRSSRQTSGTSQMLARIAAPGQYVQPRMRRYSPDL